MTSEQEQKLLAARLGGEHFYLFAKYTGRLKGNNAHRIQQDRVEIKIGSEWKPSILSADEFVALAKNGKVKLKTNGAVVEVIPRL